MIDASTENFRVMSLALVRLKSAEATHRPAFDDGREVTSLNLHP
jgi:hypothetical protein